MRCFSLLVQRQEKSICSISSGEHLPETTLKQKQLQGDMLVLETGKRGRIGIKS